MAFGLTDFDNKCLNLDTENLELSITDLEKQVIESRNALDEVLLASESISTVFEKGSAVCENILSANSVAFLDDTHLSFAREHLETIFDHCGIGRDEIVIGTDLPSLSKEEIKFKEEKKPTDFLAKVIHQIKKFIGWVLITFAKVTYYVMAHLEKVFNFITRRHDVTYKMVKKYKGSYDFLVNEMNRLFGNHYDRMAPTALAPLIFDGRTAKSGQVREKMGKMLIDINATSDNFVSLAKKSEGHFRKVVDELTSDTPSHDNIDGYLKVDDVVSLFKIEHKKKTSGDKVYLTVSQKPGNRNLILVLTTKNGVVTRVEYRKVDQLQLNKLVSIAGSYRFLPEDVASIAENKWEKLIRSGRESRERIGNNMDVCKKVTEHIGKNVISGLEKLSKNTNIDKEKVKQLREMSKVNNDLYRSVFLLVSDLLTDYTAHADTLFKATISAAKAYDKGSKLSGIDTDRPIGGYDETKMLGYAG